jgi:hypothetical protein
MRAGTTPGRDVHNRAGPSARGAHDQSSACGSRPGIRADLAGKLIKDGRLLLEGGYISLQAESHPIEFRKIELLVLED